MNFFELKYTLQTLYDRLEYRELTGNDIINFIRKEIPYSECIVNPVYTISLDSNQFDLTGCYYPDLDMLGLPCIELEILLPKMRDYYEISDDDFDRNTWKQLTFDIACVLGHEYVHLHQARRRHFSAGKQYKSKTDNPTVKETQEYLGTPDELDAYSFSAAAQMAYFLPRNVDLHDTMIYKWYTRYFKKSDTVIKILENKAQKYYNKLKRQYNETNRK